MNESEARSKIKYRIEVARQIAGNGVDGKAYEDLEIALQALKEIREYRELGTVEELQTLKENERKCEDCAGCTNWLCDCANERAKAIDEFAEKCFEEIFKNGYSLDTLDITVIAEQMKGGAE